MMADNEYTAFLENKIRENREELRKAKEKEMYAKTANQLGTFRDCLKAAGFDDEQAYDIVFAYIKKFLG